MVKRKKDFGEYCRSYKYKKVALEQQLRNCNSSSEEENGANNRQGLQWPPSPQPPDGTHHLNRDPVNCGGSNEVVRSPSPHAPLLDNGLEPDQVNVELEPEPGNVEVDPNPDNNEVEPGAVNNNRVPADADPSDPSDEDSSDESSRNDSDSDSESDVDENEGDSDDDEGGDGDDGGDDDDDDNDDDDDDGDDGDGDDDDDDDGDDGDGDDDGGGSDDDDDGIYNVVNDAPLYAGAPITVTESMLSILSLALAHNLSGSCVTDILELIAMHCPQNNLCTTSYHKFQKFCKDLKSPVNRRYICSVCYESVDNPDANCPRCQVQRKFDSYLQIPVVPQVKGLFKRPGFYEKIVNQQNRRKQVEGNYEDIYDGSIYQNLKNPGNLLAAENSFSLTWYSDGIRIFRASKNEMWPFYLTINELPYRERTKIDNVILAGLWFGKKKPLVNHFLKFIQHDLRNLREGIDVVVPNRLERMRVRGVVMCGTCDMPAKAQFLNMKQYNGVFGCQVCKIETVRENPGRLKRIYPFDFNIILRTDNEHRIFARQAQALQRPIFGVKGRTALSTFVANPIESTAVDVMHNCFMGVGKFLGSVWFLKDHLHHPASLYGHVRLIDQRLMSLQAPDFLQRQPRSIQVHFKYWNASELKAWLMVYSLPLLDGVMPEPIFNHHKLLVYGLSLLCRNSVSPDMVQLATRLLREYVNRFQLVYGLTYMSANVHLLLHLPLVVERFGPLWTTSCFPYESCNGVLKRFVSGTRHAENQIFSAASTFLNLTGFTMNHLAPGGRPFQFCDRLNHFRKKYNLSIISERLAVVGRMQRIEHLPQNILEELEHLPMVNRNYFEFYRLFDRQLKIVFSSLSYTRNSKTNSTCVKYHLNDVETFGIVHSYLKITYCDCQAACDCDGTFFAVVKECIAAPAYRVPPFGVLPLIHTCRHVDNFIAVPVANLIYVCYQIDVRDTNSTFIVEPLNTHEIE